MQSNVLQNRRARTQKNKVIQDLFCRENGGKAYNPPQRAGSEVVLAAGEGSPAPVHLMNQQPWPQPETE